MEIKNRKAVVLTTDGAFEHVTLKQGQHIEIGSEIDVPVSNYFSLFQAKRLAISIAAVVAVLLLFFTQFSMFKQSNLAVAAYISLDINPSLEVGVNEKLKVVEVIPINEDGKNIVSQIQENYRNQSLSQFINHTMELAKKDGYLKENHDVLVTTTYINKNAEAAVEANLNEIKKDIETDGVVVTTLKGDENTRKEAKDVGVSTGKYLLYKEAKENLTVEETKDLSVTKIYERLEQKKQKSSKKEIEKQQKTDNRAEKRTEKNNGKEENGKDKTQNVIKKQNDSNKNAKDVKIKKDEKNASNKKSDNENNKKNKETNPNIKKSWEDSSPKNKQTGNRKDDEKQNYRIDKHPNQSDKRKNERSQKGNNQGKGGNNQKHNN